MIIALSMFGIGALLKTSLVWLTVMKWVGGAYLVWLGIQVWRSPPIGIEVRGSAEPRAGWSLFRQGALSALTNPKGLLFFAAFLPQFIDPARSLFVQFVIMAGTFAVIEIATEMFIASMAHRISPWLRRVGRRFNQACGGVFVAIGVALPLRMLAGYFMKTPETSERHDASGMQPIRAWYVSYDRATRALAAALRPFAACPSCQ